MNTRRTVYLSIVLFVVWCIACAIWYLFSVKGLSTDPATFNGASNAVAIIEILFMTLGAFLIGFLAAFYLQEEPVKKWRIAFFSEEHERKELEFETRALKNDKEALKNEKSYLELHYKSELAQRSQANQQLATSLAAQKEELLI